MRSSVVVLSAGFRVINPRFLVLYKIEINSSCVRGRDKLILSMMIDHDNGYGPRGWSKSRGIKKTRVLSISNGFLNTYLANNEREYESETF